MKLNEPVTQHEIAFPEDSILVSKTDTKGIITYCNRAFIEISGFSQQELLGSNHNLVRHPDMPPEAFADLWNTVNQEKPWSGIVKNRAKNGDHYWVKANVAPIYKDRQIVEYISVRTQPSREEVEQAENLYSTMQQGQASLEPGFIEKLSGWFKYVSIKLLLASTVVSALGLFLLIAIMLSMQVDTKVVYSVLLIASVLVIIAGLSISSLILSPFKYAHKKLNEISQGNYFDWVEVDRKNEIGHLLEEIKMTQIKLGFDVMDARESAAESQRIKTAVDSVSTNVMLADQDLNIIYFNPAAQNMLKEAEEDIKKEFQNFDSDKLLGANIDQFHKNPAYQRGLLAHLEETHEADLVIGERTFRIIANPVFDAEHNRLGTAVEWRDRTQELALKVAEEKQLKQEREFAQENLRIRTALDNVSSSVMLADNDRNIIYLNNEAEKLFAEAEMDIQKQLPGFRADQLMNANIDQFHQHPAKQQQQIEQLNGRHEVEIMIGSRTMKFIANPVVSTNGDRIGTAVEWTDRTLEVAIEDEVEAIVAGAQNGELDARIELDGKHGFVRHLSIGINSLLDKVSEVFNEIADVMAEMEQGNLTQPISKVYKGKFGQVRNSVNVTLKHLEQTVRELRGTADQIATASDEISAGNSNLSSRTEQQAAGLEETAASMEELTSIVRNNSDNAQQANQLASNARQTAEQGGEVVSSAVQAMDEINESSNQIAEIISVIDDIAFQTNLLALNASVEAARAGEQGRGFAVVATEVRNLASRSADAAKEIKALIHDSREKVQAGAKLVSESGETLEDIVNGVKKVGDIVAEIAASSVEQSAGIDQINQAVTSMDEITQQNAALAEQTSAASVSLYEKSSEMNQMMNFFEVRANPDEAWSDELAEEENIGASGSDELDFFAARTAHLAWRQKIRDFLDGKEGLTRNQAVSHRDCALGKWLYSVGMDQYGHFDEMQVMEKDHEKMHAVIREIIELKNNGQTTTAEQQFGQIEELSKKIVSLLKQVEHKVEE